MSKLTLIFALYLKSDPGIGMMVGIVAFIAFVGFVQVFWKLKNDSENDDLPPFNF